MRAAALIAIVLAGCAPVAAPDGPGVPAMPAERTIPTGPPPDNYWWDTGIAAIETDLLASARERFGETVVRHALASPTYIFAKFYPGMLPPPQPGDPPYKPPVAILIKEEGRWLAASDSGWRPAQPDRVAEIETMLASTSFWSAPSTGRPLCTDAGAGLLMVKVPKRAETIRNGTCGPTEPNERLALAAVDS
jgi:hypothetical protein